MTWAKFERFALDGPQREWVSILFWPQFLAQLSVPDTRTDSGEAMNYLRNIASIASIVSIVSLYSSFVCFHFTKTAPLWTMCGFLVGGFVMMSSIFLAGFIALCKEPK